MEKDQGHAAATAPLPSAPPSYEEAVAISGPPRASLPNPPYPVTRATMPMPCKLIFVWLFQKKLKFFHIS